MALLFHSINESSHNDSLVSDPGEPSTSGGIVFYKDSNDGLDSSSIPLPASAQGSCKGSGMFSTISGKEI